MPQSPAPIEPPQPLLQRLAHLLLRTRLNTRIALALPVLVLLLGIVWAEGVQYVQTRNMVRLSARHSAESYAGSIASRLHQQFVELQFAAVALLGPDADPTHPDPKVVSTLKRFMALHPSLYAFNIQSADGNTILWSTRKQSATPITSGNQFTPLPGHPDFLLGQDRAAKRGGGHVLTMRCRVRADDGQTRYFVGTPYRLDQLLVRPPSMASDPWELRVVDTRDGSLLGAWNHGQVLWTAGALPTRLTVPIAGLPLAVQVAWPPGMAWRQYAEHAWPRWIVEITALALLALAARQLAVLLRQLDRQQRLYHALAQTADATLRARDRSDLLRQVCTELVTNTPFHAARIGRPDKDGCIQLLAAAGEGAAQLPQDACLQTAQSGNAPLVVRAWMQQQLVYDNDLLANPQSAPWREFLQRNAWRAGLAVPILRSGAIWAVLAVASPQKGVFDEQTVALCRRIGELLSQGESAQYVQRKLMALLRQFDRQQHLYQALAQTADALLRSKDEIDLLHQVCTELATNAPFHAVWIGHPDKGGPFHVLAAAGEGSARLPQDVHMQAAQSGKVPLVVQAWLERRLICHNDPLADPRLAHWREIFRGNAWRAMLMAPIVRSGALWALLVVVSSQPNVFDNQTEELYRRIGDLLGQGLTALDAQRQLASREQESDHRARHDALTHLPNRFALEQHVPQAIARARRRGQVLALGMLDLDDFKPVNDTWGHAAGDVVLQEFARRLRSLLREVVFVGRLGGDEFVVVFEDLDPDQAQAQLRIALERVHRAVEEPFALGEHQASIGMSLGLALYPDDGQEMDALLRQADAALYRLKMHKVDRPTWWALATDPQDNQPEAQPETPWDPFGPQAAALIARTQAQCEEVIAPFVTAFYADMLAQPSTREVLEHLSEDELRDLQTRQAAHLRALLDAHTSAEAIAQMAQHVGQIHALCGVKSADVLQMMGSYLNHLSNHWARAGLRSADRMQLQDIAVQRLQMDLKAQLGSMETTISQYFAALGQPLPASGTWVDKVEQELQALAALPGILAAVITRPDAAGLFRLLHSAGQVAQDDAQKLWARYTPSLDPNHPRGQSPVAVAWRAGQIQSKPQMRNEPMFAVYQAAFQAGGVKSAIYIPLLDAANHLTAMVILYGAHVHQFESPWVRQFALSLQQRLSALQQTTPPTVDQPTAALWRQALLTGGLVMLVQPVVDLKSGTVCKVEALARLRLPSGEVIGPGQFLPVLGQQELNHLFILGMDQALAAVRTWEAAGLQVQVSINLPPTTLLEADCVQWVQQALARHQVDAACLELELLEDHPLDDAQQNRTIQALHALGVKLAMDDLGSGYSSLLRLKTQPFDTLKIDQGLMLGLGTEPQQTLALIASLIQIGHDLDEDVVVEGLETPAMIEAARILGARFGQGFGLARPMPIAEFAAWHNTWSLPGTEGIQTALGALAYHWQFVHTEECVHPGTAQDCPLTAFLQRLGPSGSAAAQMHHRVHEAASVHERKQASEALTKLLVEMVRQG